MQGNSHTQEAAFMTNPQSERKKIQQQTKTWADYGIQALLALSFVLIGVYYAFVTYNGTHAFPTVAVASSNFWTYVIFLAIVFWLVFELIMRLYFFFVSLSIYVFVVPKKESFNLFRLFYAFRNFVVGAVYLLVFKFPLMFNFLGVIAIAFDFVFLFLFFFVIKKKFLNDLLAPFALKAFIRPFLIYQIVVAVFTFGGLLI